MPPTSALVVAPYWANLLLSGEKKWELRGKSTPKRGRIAIAASGTGTLLGEIHIIDSVKVLEDGVSLLPLPLSSFEPLHCVKDLRILKYRKVHAWVMRDPIRYDRPRKYVHKTGAVTWVSLSNPKGSAN